MEKACPHAVGLGRVNRLAQKLLKLSLDLHRTPILGRHAHPLDADFCDSRRVHPGVLATAREPEGKPARVRFLLLLLYQVPEGRA